MCPCGRDARPRKQAEALLRQHREEMERALTFQVAQQTVAGIEERINYHLVRVYSRAVERLLDVIKPQEMYNNPHTDERYREEYQQMVRSVPRGALRQQRWQGAVHALGIRWWWCRWRWQRRQ